jgi:hypothetical protein
VEFSDVDDVDSFSVTEEGRVVFVEKKYECHDDLLGATGAGGGNLLLLSEGEEAVSSAGGGAGGAEVDDDMLSWSLVGGATDSFGKSLVVAAPEEG